MTSDAKYGNFFLRVSAPGQILRYLQRNNLYPRFSCPLLLSDSVGNNSLRCLSIDGQVAESPCAFDWMQSVGPALSEVFPPRATFLWRQVPSSKLGVASWGYVIWEDGKVVETAEYSIPTEPKPGLLSCLPGMKRRAALSPDTAWALARGLPIDRVPAAGLRRNIPVIDYDTVAQLDQRSLLVETTPRLYRFTL